MSPRELHLLAYHIITAGVLQVEREDSCMVSIRRNCEIQRIQLDLQSAFHLFENLIYNAYKKLLMHSELACCHHTPRPLSHPCLLP